VYDELDIHGENSFLLGASDGTPCLEREVLVFSEDYVVENVDAEELARFHEAPRKGEIVGRGLGITRRMVVDEDQAHGTMPDGWTKHLPGMDKGGRERSDGNHEQSEHLVACSNKDHGERFPIVAFGVVLLRESRNLTRCAECYPA
jgi:hypothetical protein